MGDQTETGLLRRFLDEQRNHVLGILEGLSDEQLRRPVLPSGWHCLGMVKHLAARDTSMRFGNSSMAVNGSSSKHSLPSCTSQPLHGYLAAAGYQPGSSMALSARHLLMLRPTRT